MGPLASFWNQPPTESRVLLLLLLSCFSRVRFCATPWTAAYQAPPSVRFSRQEYWSGVPLPSPRPVKLQQISSAWPDGFLCTSIVFQIDNWLYSGKKRKQIPKFERRRMDAEEPEVWKEIMIWSKKGHCVKKKFFFSKQEHFYTPTYHTFIHFSHFHVKIFI